MLRTSSAARRLGKTASITVQHLQFLVGNAVKSVLERWCNIVIINQYVFQEPPY